MTDEEIRTLRARSMGHVQKLFAEAMPGATPVPEPVDPVGAKVDSLQDAQAEQKPKVVQLDQVTLLKIELVASKRRLNKAEEEKLLLLMQSIRKEAKELQIEESRLFAEVVQRLGVEPGKNLRLLDREKGLCAIE